jgi:formate dehydrogenase assembly factor FdhD
MKKNDEFFELVCIYPDSQEFSLGFYTSQKIANEQKDICEKQAEKEEIIYKIYGKKS